MSYEPEFDEATPDEDEASWSSLDLTPWVAPQAAAIREQHMQERAAERPEATRIKVHKWRTGICRPREGRHGKRTA